MRANRYLNVVLTIIAIELGWLTLSYTGTPVTAQQAATPVVITGVQVPPNAFLPVGVLGQVDDTRFEPLDVRTIGPVKIETDRPIAIETIKPIEVRIPVTSSPVPFQ